MWAFLGIWIWIVLVSILLVICRYTCLTNILLLFPITLTILFVVFKNNTSLSHSNCIQLFQDFKLGGHRGSPQNAPENTIESLQKAKEEGCDLVEFDIHISKDGVPLLMHDDTTERTATQNLVVANTDWKSIEKVQLKTVNNVAGSVSKLNDTVDWCLKNNLKMIFDVKNSDYKLLTLMAKEIRKRNIYDKVLVSSFNPLVGYNIKKIDAKIVTGLTLDRSYYSYEDDDRKVPFSLNIFTHWFHELLDEINVILMPTYILPRFIGVDVLMFSYKLVSHDSIREAKENGFQTVAWTVNDIDYMKIMSQLGVPFLTDISSKINRNDLFKNA